MTVSVATTSKIEAPLLDDGDDDVLSGTVDYKGRPSIRSKSGCWKSSVFLLGVGVAERFAYYGIGLNLISYLTGSLGLSTAAAASTLNAWFGVASLLPILGSFLAESYSGRFWMIIFASILYTLGLIFLSLSAFLTESAESNSSCKTDTPPCSPPKSLIIFFFFSWYLVALAQGGHTPCAQAFGADQFDEEDEEESKAKNSFFNWWYCFSSGFIVVPLLAITYIQEHLGWVIGFGIPAVIMALTLILFLIGMPTYRFRTKGDQKNPFVRILRGIFKAAKNWWTYKPITALSTNEETRAMLLQKAAQFKFLDNASIASSTLLEDEILSSFQDIEDAKSILRLVPIWCTIMGYSIVYAQPSTLFTKQAQTIDRHIGSSFEIPAASLQNCFIAVSLIIFIPIYDRVFVPIARAITKKPSGITMLQRIGVGLVLSLISILYAAIVERKRLAMAVEYGLLDTPNEMIPMSAWWLAPQYIVSGTADVFTMIGIQEFFYEEVPHDMKSVGLAMYLSILGIGSLLSSFLVAFIQNVTKGNGQGGWFANNLNRAHIDYYYWLLTGFSAFSFGAYVYFARSYVYRRRSYS